MDKKADAARYKVNWQEERDSVALYRAIAELEPQTQLKEVYGRMARAEESHARFWEEKIRGVGEAVPEHKVGWRTSTRIWLAHRFGIQFVLPSISTLEHVGSGVYDKQSEARSENLPMQERSHARLLEAITGTNGKGLPGNEIATLEGRHRATGGNALRAAVLGANDGLVSNLSLVMGVAGADLSGRAVLVTGLAGLLAGACSMALGEWVSVQSAREFYQKQIAVEQEELNEVPDEEQAELALIYESKGLPQDEAKALAEKVISDDSIALDTLAREELGINPDELGGSAWTASITSFLLFALGAIFPVFPFFFLSGTTAVLVSLGLSAVALFGIGAGITLLTGRNVLFSGTRMVIFGLLAAAVTFGIGKLIGVAIAG